MDETIYIKYLWKTEDIVRAYKYHLKSSTLYRILTVFYILIGIIHTSFGLFSFFSSRNLGSLFYIVIGLFFLFNNRITVFFFVRNFEKLNYENKQVEWEISKTKIVSRIMNLS